MDVTQFNLLMVGITLIGLILAVITLLIGFFYFTRSVVTRITNLERRQDAFQDKIGELMQTAFKRVPVSENPGEEMAASRDYLLTRLRANQLSRSEAMELNDILIEEQRAAQKRNDIVALVAIILGLALLASILSKR